MNGIMAHGATVAKQRWQCFGCEKNCTKTIGLNDDPDEGGCNEKSIATLPEV